MWIKKAWLPCWPSKVSRCHTRVECEESIAGGWWSTKTKDPHWLWNSGQTSPDIQNRGTSGPTKKTDVLQNFQKKFSVSHLKLFPYVLPADVDREGPAASVRPRPARWPGVLDRLARQGHQLRQQAGRKQPWEAADGPRGPDGHPRVPQAAAARWVTPTTDCVVIGPRLHQVSASMLWQFYDDARGYCSHWK